MAYVPADSLADVAVAELFERFSLGWVVLAAVLGEAVDGLWVPGNKSAKSASWAHRAELVVVACQDQLGPSELYVSGEPGEVDVVGHANFIEQDRRLFVEAELSMVEAPDKARQGARLADAGLFGKVAGGLARSGGAEDLVAATLERFRNSAQHRRLAGARDPDHDLGPTARCTDANGRPALLFG